MKPRWKSAECPIPTRKCSATGQAIIYFAVPPLSSSERSAWSQQTGALTFGLIITVMIAATGNISGAHFNPAVTIAFAVTRHFPWREVVFYITAQVSAAILGAITLRLLFGDVASLGATLPSGTLAQSFVLEVLLSAVLMFVIISVATDTKAVGAPAALTIGFTVALDAMWGGPISGASMNPARSFGPAVVAGVWEAQWIYWLAPVIGAIIGALIYQGIREPKGTNEAENRDGV